ncbi:flagellar motor protein MotB [Stieleria mannarensis]|uniref:flagellar motor protein MotB n=1 Tax=Stieleria mannarensis TaxID=2755585 RepID=UPI0016020573|nr:flagellar motor protein MotB [Rhodopirellula sp. JC639]
MASDLPEDPPEDIPAWFMTYSDVITLLMTFFILLLTFATTEPERFEKVTASVFGAAGAKGVAGHEHDMLDRNSWSQRIRPRAARIAMQGSEMPPIQKDVTTKAIGRGLEAVSELASQKDVMKTYAFEMPLEKLVDQNLKLTQRGTKVAAKLSEQLRSLSIHCTFEISDRGLEDRVCAFAHHLYHVQRARPGQIGTSIADNVTTKMVRIVIEKYEGNR